MDILIAFIQVYAIYFAVVFSIFAILFAPSLIGKRIKR